MPRETLKKRLSELHAELESADDIGEDALPLIRQLSDDLERLLGGSEAEDEPESEEDETIVERMRDALLALEAKHPQVTHAVNRVSTALSNMGI